MAADTGRTRQRVAHAADQANTVERTQPQHPTQVLLEQLQPQLVTALPRGMDVARFTRTVWSVVRESSVRARPDQPTLLEATPASVVSGVFKAAQLGLELALDHAYLIPFRNSKTGTVEAQFILGYKGIIALARRSGAVETIVARAVHPGDHFEYSYGLTADVLSHRPDGDPEQLLTHVYAIARYVGGGYNVEVLTKGQVDSYRKRSHARSSGPWVTDYESMALKTVIRRLQRWLPLTVEETQLLHSDERVYSLADRGDTITVEPDDTPLADVEPAGELDPPHPEPEPDPPAPEPNPMLDEIDAVFITYHVDLPADRLAVVSAITGRTVTHPYDLRPKEQAVVRDRLEQWAHTSDFTATMHTFLAEAENR